LPGFDANAFEEVHRNTEVITSVRLNPAKKKEFPVFDNSQSIPWAEQGLYLPERPAFIFDPLLHAGVYYVQEASSMFIEQAFKQVIPAGENINVLDLCAAPGGKSTHLQSLIGAESMLVSNEVIRTRNAILAENTTKWGGKNVVITQNDPADFARLPGFFDLILIDAPCSGSGLIRRQPEALDEWSEANVKLCSERQQRIIADAWPALKPGGWLFYATCSFSPAENEELVDWILDTWPATTKRLALGNSWGIAETMSSKGGYGYRFWPHRLKGEGFFLACFQKNDEEETFNPGRVKKKIEKPTKAELELLQSWVKELNPANLFKNRNQVCLTNSLILESLVLLQEHLYIRQAGVCLGTAMGKDWLPDHALAMSDYYAADLPGIDLDLEAAIRYLRRDELNLPDAGRGWRLVRYREQGLGWLKALGNRVNNYYPKEYRILKPYTP
jgi:16S rRNA C967 or C1407 C5-methylase (RsmB/RsmF family)/NOL1/NOP2/fmu family ribosome biogenesis protein